ncbi:unnamed protein product [Allacma fusca]|uniref:Uncharacterized protein n=1 Tax=Allacma fusca TaxID=39272 RepID=A0A8J2LMA9_9HEXA|nr:unnamed protein product [Allacma fusca]
MDECVCEIKKWKSKSPLYFNSARTFLVLNAELLGFFRPALHETQLPKFHISCHLVIFTSAELLVDQILQS